MSPARLTPPNGKDRLDRGNVTALNIMTKTNLHKIWLFNININISIYTYEALLYWRTVLLGLLKELSAEPFRRGQTSLGRKSQTAAYSVWAEEQWLLALQDCSEQRQLQATVADVQERSECDTYGRLWCSHGWRLRSLFSGQGRDRPSIISCDAAVRRATQVHADHYGKRN